MVSSCLPYGIRVVETVAAASGLVLNMILCLLIFSRSGKDLRAYNRVLACNCFVDIIFCILGYVFEMASSSAYALEHADVRSGVYIVWSNGLYAGDSWGNFLQLCLFMYVVYLTITIVSVPTIFRYFAICREHILTNWQFAALVSVVVFLPGAVPLSALMLWYPTSVRTSVVYEDRLKEMECSDSGLVVLFPLSEMLTFNVATTIVVVLGVVGATYMTVVFCSVAVWKKSQGFRNQTQRIQRLQQQLNYALLAQALIPIFVIVIPIAALTGTMLAGLEQLRTFTVLSTSVLAFIPLVNAACTIVIIRPYREAVLGCVGKFSGSSAPRWVPRFKVGRVSAATEAAPATDYPDELTVATVPF